CEKKLTVRKGTLELEPRHSQFLIRAQSTLANTSRSCSAKLDQFPRLVRPAPATGASEEVLRPVRFGAVDHRLAFPLVFPSKEFAIIPSNMLISCQFLSYSFR